MENLKNELERAVRGQLKMNPSHHLNAVLENLINEVVANEKAADYALPLMRDYVIVSYQMWKTNEQLIAEQQQKEVLDYWQGKLAQLMMKK